MAALLTDLTTSATAALEMTSSAAVDMTAAAIGSIEGKEIWIVVVGFIIAFILAIGIGANDVANTFGTSVGARVLTLRQACIIASIVETLGAILLGSKVTETVRKGIIDISTYENQTELLMAGNVAALTGSCAWLFIATAAKMPVSGTHSIVGATVGFTLVAQGSKGVDWKQLIFIVLSWFISPVLSGAVSVGLFLVCKYFILTKEDPLEPGLRFLPIFYSCTIIINCFSIFYEGPAFLGFDKIPVWGIFVLSFGAGLLTAFVVRSFLVPYQRKQIKRDCKKARDFEASNHIEAQRDSENESLVTKDNNLENGDNNWRNNKSRCEDNCNEKMPLSETPLCDISATETYLNETGAGDNHVFPNEKCQTPTVTFAAMETTRARSTSLYTKSPNQSETGNDTKRHRSKSESQGAKSDTVPRNRAYSDAIDDLHDRGRFMPVANSMALNIEKRQARSQEKKCEKEGLDTEQTAERTRQVIEDKPEQHRLFAYLQILTAIFGGFAHGGNDVSNAIGPLVSIWLTAMSVPGPEGIAAKAQAPLWILLYGGIGISVGLWIWGRRVIKTMGEDLAKITPSTGFCIELGAAATVLTASNLRLPISTTHCKVGSVVFVGWARARKNVNWRLFSSIILAWILTLPVAGGISAAVMAILKLFV